MLNGATRGHLGGALGAAGAATAEAMLRQEMEAKRAQDQEFTGLPSAGIRVIIERAYPSVLTRPEPSAVPGVALKRDTYFYAGTVVGMGGDHVMVEVGLLGTHLFSRETGRWMEGPFTNLEDCGLHPESLAAVSPPQPSNRVR